MLSLYHVDYMYSAFDWHWDFKSVFLSGLQMYMWSLLKTPVRPAHVFQNWNTFPAPLHNVHADSPKSHEAKSQFNRR